MKAITIVLVLVAILVFYTFMSEATSAIQQSAAAEIGIFILILARVAQGFTGSDVFVKSEPKQP